MNNKQYPAELFMWLIEVASASAIYYGRIPLEDLYKVFQSGKDQVPGVGDIGEEEFETLLRGYLAIGNNAGVAGTPAASAFGLTCKIRGKEVVDTNLSEQDLKNIRDERKAFRMQFGEKEFKILTYDQVDQIFNKGYYSTPGTDEFEAYLKRKWHKSSKEAEEIAYHIAYGFRVGRDFTAGINELSRILGTNTKEKAVTMDELNELVQAVMGLYHSTAQMDRFGWTPEELSKERYGGMQHVDMDKNGMPMGPLPNGAKVVPGSSVMAQMMKDNADVLKERGVAFDLDASASRYSEKTTTPEGNVVRGRSKKIYPNDPCPCGSGLKYKDCHGKKTEA